MHTGRTLTVCRSLLPRGGVLSPRGVYLVPGVGVLSPRGCLLPGGWYPSMHWGRHPPVNRMTDRCKNVTLATTSLRPVINQVMQVYIVLPSCQTDCLVIQNTGQLFVKFRFYTMWTNYLKGKNCQQLLMQVGQTVSTQGFLCSAHQKRLTSHYYSSLSHRVLSMVSWQGMRFRSRRNFSYGSYIFNITIANLDLHTAFKITDQPWTFSGHICSNYMI